jgi:NAD(P)-dependent dehydrogenase (short-subunit alcohol dehydrogenase family)
VTVGLVADVSTRRRAPRPSTGQFTPSAAWTSWSTTPGSAAPTPTSPAPACEFRRVLDVNLTGIFLMCREVAKVMIGQGSGGAIVNLGSVFGQQGVAGGAGYCASKAGVALLTHSLALELAPHNIRANTIAPGNMATEMHWDELRSRAAQVRAAPSTSRWRWCGPPSAWADTHRRRHRGRGGLAGLSRRRLTSPARRRGERCIWLS